MRRSALHLGLAVIGALVLVIGAAPAGSQAIGPSVGLEKVSVVPGERILVSLHGFRASAVIVTVCGNAAARGSVDCGVQAGRGVPLTSDGAQQVYLAVAAPPMPCPCVVQAATTQQDEVASTPIDIVGHPVAAVVRSPDRSPLEVRVDASRVVGGLFGRLRSSLGGRASYDIAVLVRNRSAETVTDVSLAGVVQGGRDDAAQFSLPDIAELGPGETWTHTVRAGVPTLVIGEVTFGVSSVGSGPAAVAADTVQRAPYLLVLAAVLLTADLIALVVRRIRARGAASDGIGTMVSTAGAR